ncbi:MAG: cobalamin biosynthesis protein, partial [Lachnospiraceae bacterium]|nr:cobalamin biosynthesis protein [Lachnospiraceae bacterium]
MEYHIVAFAVGFILDMFLGDPYWLPHPIRAIGNLISWLEERLLGKKTEELAQD